MTFAIITETVSDPAPFFWCMAAAGLVVVALSATTFLRRMRPKPSLAQINEQISRDYRRFETERLQRRVEQAQAAFDRTAITHRGRGTARAALLKAKHDLKTYEEGQR